jgi:polycomb protein EED
MWRIEGFSSRDPPPPASSAPTTSDAERLTRSAFVPTTASTCPPQYTRMIQFHTPGSGHQFYMRFKLFHDKDKHPVLAFGNAHSTIFFWDLARLTGYHTFKAELNDSEREGTVQRPNWLLPVVHRQKGDTVSKLRDAEDRDSVVSGRTGSEVETQQGGPTNHYTQETLDTWQGKYDMTRVDEAIKAHSQSTITIKDFIGRQVAWSPQGDWCVVVGSKTLAVILNRWQKREREEKKAAAQAAVQAAQVAQPTEDVQATEAPTAQEPA